MRPLVWAGILFIVLGGLALVYHGFSYHRRKDVFNMGSVHVINRTERHVDVPPVVGGLMILGGIILVVAGSRQRA